MTSHNENGNTSTVDENIPLVENEELPIGAEGEESDKIVSPENIYGARCKLRKDPKQKYSLSTWDSSMSNMPKVLRSPEDAACDMQDNGDEGIYFL